jgi:hypothetical protein
MMINHEILVFGKGWLMIGFFLILTSDAICKPGPFFGHWAQPLVVVLVLKRMGNNLL